MLIITGVNIRSGKRNPHIIVSDDGNAALWVGVIDDLWKLGKPTGRGGLEARWIRFIASRDCSAMAWLVYE